MSMRVAYLGPPGTFSHEALSAAAPDAQGAPVATLYDAIMAVHDGTVGRALVPIENSLEGSVNATLDTLAHEASDVVIVGEVVHQIAHCLVARESIAPAAIRSVVSHPQASGQCARFIREELTGAGVLAATSTSDAVRLVAEGAIEPQPAAALGTRLAAELYGCQVIRDGVEDHASNATRFVWLAPGGGVSDELPNADADAAHKTSLIFWGAGTEAPGWLVRCLSEFAFRGVNLTRIESRPRREGLGSYLFFVDLDGRASDPAVSEAIAGLGAQADVVRVLGSYAAAP